MRQEWELHLEKKYSTLGLSMQEELRNTPYTDPSGLYSTYKTHITENGDVKTYKQDNIPSPLIQNRQKKDKNMESILQIIINGGVRIMQTLVWSITIIIGIFIASLASNTFNQAIEILNKNFSTHISTPEKKDIFQETSESTLENIPSENVISDKITTENPSETIANKRKLILEAKKTAKIMEEQQKSADQNI